MKKTETHAGRVLEFAESEEDLRGLYGPPSDIAARKCLLRLDEHCRHFIERSPFVCLSSASPDGSADISPRGDAPGFVRVLDDQTLFVPDRLGNNRIDSLRNLVLNPPVGLLFLIPGVDETLRVNGVARVVLRSELLDECAVGGKTPRSGILVEVREAFLQCAKALKRSKLWSDDYRLTPDQMPTLGQMLVDQLCLTTPVSELDAMIDKAYREKLY
ncbi:pyridoxamine 5'-phosphate oxidase-like FMN-binding protein [Planctomycetia bacterium]|nr:pyridoxamine 5'-phosphate oxidase-like FMN-binding protein [Planctomycetia bacterium]